MKKIVIVLTVISILLIASTMTFADNSATVTVDLSNVSTGVVGVSYNFEEGSKIKVLVEKDDVRYTYDLVNNEQYEYFPLQLGNGKYDISVLINTSGNNYKFLHRSSFNVNLDNSDKVFLASVQNISWDKEDEAIKLAAELTKELKTDNEKIQAIYNYVLSNFKYDYKKARTVVSNYVPNINETVKSNKGICYDYSSVIASMLRSQGIPTKLIKGYTKNVNGYHAWNEVYDSESKEWKVIDATYDSTIKFFSKKFEMFKENSDYTVKYEY